MINGQGIECSITSEQSQLFVKYVYSHYKNSVLCARYIEILCVQFKSLLSSLSILTHLILSYDAYAMLSYLIAKVMLIMLVFD